MFPIHCCLDEYVRRGASAFTALWPDRHVTPRDAVGWCARPTPPRVEPGGPRLPFSLPMNCDRSALVSVFVVVMIYPFLLWYTPEPHTKARHNACRRATDRIHFKARARLETGTERHACRQSTPRFPRRCRRLCCIGKPATKNALPNAAYQAARRNKRFTKRTSPVAPASSKTMPSADHVHGLEALDRCRRRGQRIEPIRRMDGA